MTFARRFWIDESGTTAHEFAILVALLAAVCVGILTGLVPVGGLL